jgi:hypothetical protein
VVSRGVAEGVVDPLEAVQIQYGDADGAAAAQAALCLGLESPQQMAAVEQAGEGVAYRQFTQARDRFFQL